MISVWTCRRRMSSRLPIGIHTILLFLSLFTGTALTQQGCDTISTRQQDGKVFHTPWLPDVSHPIKITISADETNIYLSNQARATISVDDHYRISLDGTISGLGSADATSIFLGPALVQRDLAAVNFLTAGTNVDIWIDVVTVVDDPNEEDTQRIDITRGDAMDYVISWTNRDRNTFVDIRYIGTWNWGGDARYVFCDILPILRSTFQPSTQSSVHAGLVASNVVDSSVLTCSLTQENGDNAWWRVDLGDEYDVRMVILVNTGDVNAYKLTNSKVLVGSCPYSNRDDNKECGGAVTTSEALDGLPILKSCTQNTYGQYVFVDAAAGTLALCDVKVYGEEIPDEDKVKMYFADAGYSVQETQQTPLTINVGRTGAYPTCSSAEITFTDGAATRNVDFTIPATSYSVFFGLNDNSEQVTLMMKDDDLAESSEGLTATLVTDTFVGGLPGGRTSTPVTILDDDSVTYRFAQTTHLVKESVGYVGIEVTRSGGTANVGDVVFIITLGSALPLSDYRNNPVQLHFDTGVTSQTGQIEIIDDTNVENSEEFYVTMNVQTNFGEVDPNYERVTVSITDNDDEFYLEQTAIGVSEEETPKIVIYRRGTLELASVVELHIVPGTAKSESDYDSANIVTLQFSDNRDRIEHSISLVDDAVGEEDESFTVELRTDAGPIVDGRNRVAITIRDNDARYILESTFYSVDEHQPTVQIALLRVGYTGIQTMARLTTSFVTASNSDFTSIKYYPVTFSPEQDRAEVGITIQDDTEVEFLETFNVFIEAADGVIGSPSQAFVTIIDNDGTVSLGSEAFQVSEDDVTLRVDVTRDGVLDNRASVRILSSTITATSNDFHPVDETLVFPANTPTQSVYITIVQEFLPESDETFLLLLSSAINMTLGEVSRATVTILDSDVSLTLTTASPPEPSGPTLTTEVIIGIAVAGGVLTLIAVGLVAGMIYIKISRERASPMKSQNIPGYPPPPMPTNGGGASQQSMFGQQFGGLSGFSGNDQMGAFQGLQGFMMGEGSQQANQMAALNMPNTYHEMSNGMIQTNQMMPFVF